MRALVDEIRAGLRAAADPARAQGQQAYMKSEMPFLGVTVPDARRIARAAAKGVTDAGVLRAAARTLWDEASHREERYAAEALLATKPVDGHLAAVPLIEHMVRTGRWWDFTDELAHRVAALHDRHPTDTAALARGWSTDSDLWMRRLAILSQLGRGARLDRDLLADLLEPNLADAEFFIRKAIGWALRECARVDPEWVREYAASHALSPLSRREALKHL
ncbi:MAG: DNA alkylation repair protein [Microbacterium sp.]